MKDNIIELHGYLDICDFKYRFHKGSDFCVACECGKVRLDNRVLAAGDGISTASEHRTSILRRWGRQVFKRVARRYRWSFVKYHGK